jgi:hypothetical protein
MPRVGQTNFPYTPQGRQAADQYARRTGQRAQDLGVNQARGRVRGPSPQATAQYPGVGQARAQIRGEDPRANPNVYRTTMQEIRDRDEARRPRADVGRGTGFLPTDYDYGELQRRVPGPMPGPMPGRGPGRGPWGAPPPGLTGGQNSSLEEKAVRAQMRSVLELLSPEERMDPAIVDQLVQMMNQQGRRA